MKDHLVIMQEIQRTMRETHYIPRPESRTEVIPRPLTPFEKQQLQGMRAMSGAELEQSFMMSGILSTGGVIGSLFGQRGIQ